MALTQLINSNVNNQFGLTSKIFTAAKYYISTLITDDFYKSRDPQKGAGQRKMTNHDSHNASHDGRRRAEECGEPIINWHIASANMAGRKCWTAKPNTLRPPYQFMNVMDPAVGTEPVGLQWPFGCAIRNCIEPVCACTEGQAFLRELRRAHSTTIQTAHRGEIKREYEQVFMGQQQENSCYITITPYDGEDCTDLREMHVDGHYL